MKRKLKQIKYIFVGNRAGGTSFVANYLTSCGFLCGHEMLDFDFVKWDWHVGESGLVWVDGKRLFEVAVGESSYIADRWYQIPPFTSVPVILIIRNPVDVVESLMAEAINHGEIIDVNALIDEVVSK